MNITSIGSQMSGIASVQAMPSEVSESKPSFGNMLNSLEQVEKRYAETQKNSYESLVSGEGSTHDMLINLQKATSEIKTLGVVRDKFVEGYQTIMSMQL